MQRYRAKAVLFLLGGVLALGLVALAWTIGPGSSQAQQGAMHNCPQAGKWAISVWDGADGTDTSEALATCGEGAVDFAYYIDPDTQTWLRYFAARTDISNLLTLNNMQGVLAYGAVGAPPPTPTPAPTATPVNGEVTITGELVAIWMFMPTFEFGGVSGGGLVGFFSAIEDDSGNLVLLSSADHRMDSVWEDGLVTGITLTIAGCSHTYSTPFVRSERLPLCLGQTYVLTRSGKRITVTGVVWGHAECPIESDWIRVETLEGC